MPFITKYPTVASGDADWSSPNNIKVEDAVSASSGGWTTNKNYSGFVTGKTFALGLPSSVIIDGIMVEIKISTFAVDQESITISNNGGTKTATKFLFQNPSSLIWLSVGGPTDLWGRTDWTYSDLNHANFATILGAHGFSSSGSINVDAVRVTVYYHVGLPSPPTDVPTRETYKVYNQKGIYIGNFPTPTTPLNIVQDINTLGSQITVKVPVSADTSAQSTDIYTVENLSANYTTEDTSGNYTTEGQIPIVSAGFQGIDTLIKNGNTVQVWIYNYFYPNGKCMFIGKIRRWEADFVTDNIDVILYSTGYDADNYVVRGAPFVYTNDVSQTANNTSDTITVYPTGGWFLYGQTWTVGAGVTNLGSISVLLNGFATVTVNVYRSGILIGTSTQNVAASGNTVIQFGFPSLITTTPGESLFFDVRPAASQSIIIVYQNTAVAGGTAMTSTYAGGSGGGSYTPITGSLYFITASGTPTTTATFSSKDPTVGMLAPIITDYNSRGGALQWTASTIDATGLSLTYTFNVQTIYDALRAILSLSPNGFYYYVDLGAQTIYFKNQSTTADFLLTKGVDISGLKLITTTENSINTFLFTGGPTSGVNLYRQYLSQQSIDAFGPLLDRKTDNRVTVTATADAIGTSEIAELNGEQYQTTISIPHTKQLDITLLVPGKVVGFRGFGTFIDSITAQIVHREWTAESVNLTLGVLPIRMTTEIEQTIRDLTAQQTQNNPTSPS